MTTVMFWSPDGGHGRTSSHTAITAVTASLQYRLRLLLCHNQCRNHSIEAGLVAAEVRMGHTHPRKNPGVDRLHYLYKSGILTCNNVSDYMIPLLKDRLDLLIGTEERGQKLPDHSFWKYLLTVAGEYYDLILMDAGSGAEQIPLLAEADLIVVNLSQNITQLKAFFHEYAHTEVFRSRPWIPVLGAYQPESLLTAASIVRKFSVHQSMYMLNYYQAFQDAWNTQNLLSFMRQHLILDRTHTESADFLRQSFFLTAAVMEQLGGVPVLSGSVVRFPIPT
ncbi:hypothetical protein [Paenibacillus wulumuqiensis]|uniref:hypothetical protein n=1 Tax=Paenibacillus wulumuqiensis TaxID=1567107 RepID=UPI000619B2FA|nr:hypothetical protein [Paenibacillus wulumuqiensis]